LEGLSLALLDAMGAGVCALTSDIPENCEVVEGAGYTFEAGNAGDLARMLRMLLADPQARRKAGRNAQARIRDHYLWPGIATEVSRLYAELSGRARPTAASLPVAVTPEEGRRRAA
jgi:glycosyltransferase involved in cell wall biosynthesis